MTMVRGKVLVENGAWTGPEGIGQFMSGPLPLGALLARGPDAEEFGRFVEMVVHANKPFMGAVLNSAFALDLRPDLPKITAPTLVIRGEHDAARTQAHVDELLAGIAESTALEIPGARTFPAGRQPGTSRVRFAGFC